ncbi:sushi domain-containing protein 4 isoform X2 [Pongo pygmaeus]|uniref:Sushi domain-containing protein 4 n=1 Tax=Pongo abelii TaxID=9601 RepID=A0A2J8U2D0_PONAB|nr:sushi domain-containing protein 4 isoform X2 [Pongo pygmaeus]PNJ39436.1 SUSD4 isoform 7 [Pongo abelii]
MYHGMNPSNGDGFLEQQQQQQPQSPQRLLAVILWFQLALCFGPAQLTGGFDDLQACADPGIPENGFRTPSGGVFFEGSVARFHCQDGFKLKGATKRLCLKHFNGTLGWIPSDSSICVQEDVDYQKRQPVPTRASICMSSPRYSVLIFHLLRREGAEGCFYLSPGPLSFLIYAAVNRSHCSPVLAPLWLPYCRIPQIEDAEIHNKTYRHGEKLIITCHEGFKIRYPDLHNMVSLCRDDGTWNNLPICQGCLRPLASSNGYVNISEFQTSFPVGTVIYYRCFPGFKLDGSAYLECLHNLIWSSSPPRCLALEVCPLPPMVSHGDFVCHPRPCERYNHGTVVEFYCDPGYSLTSDYKYITCQYGEWFPSYQVYCIKSEQTWPSTHETLLTTWKIVAFTATSVLLVLLLVILARMFQTKFKAHFPPRGPPRSSSSDPDFVVVDGVPVMLPSYDEAVSGGLSALGPGYMASVGQGCPLPVDDQSPPAYPGSGDTDTGPGESETCDSVSGSSELLQSLYSPPRCQESTHPASDNPDTIASTAEEVASTSPGIDIADEIPLMEEDP